MLVLDEKNAYVEADKASCIQNVYNLDTQVRLGKDRDRVSIGEDKEENPSPSAYGKFNNVLLSEPEYENLKKDYPNYYESYIDKFSCFIEGTGKKYSNHYAIIVKWLDEDKRKNCLSKKYSYAGYDLELYEKMLDEADN